MNNIKTYQAYHTSLFFLLSIPPDAHRVTSRQVFSPEPVALLLVVRSPHDFSLPELCSHFRAMLPATCLCNRTWIEEALLVVRLLELGGPTIRIALAGAAAAVSAAAALLLLLQFNDVAHIYRRPSFGSVQGSGLD